MPNDRVSRAAFVLTPQSFYELFLLCLHWQADITDQFRDYTTVDKVTRILSGLGLITSKQRKVLFRNRVLQQHFLTKAKLIYCNTELLAKDDDGNIPIKDVATRIIIQLPSQSHDLNRERMLRDYRIHLGVEGRAFAEPLEEKYADVLTRDAYFAEIEAQRTHRSPHGPTRYRARVLHETKDDESS